MQLCIFGRKLMPFGSRFVACFADWAITKTFELPTPQIEYAILNRPCLRRLEKAGAQLAGTTNGLQRPREIVTVLAVVMRIGWLGEVGKMVLD